MKFHIRRMIIQSRRLVFQICQVKGRTRRRPSLESLPTDFAGSQRLAELDKFQFQHWAVSLIDARPLKDRHFQQRSLGSGLLPCRPRFCGVISRP